MFLTDKFCYISISRTGTRSVLSILDKMYKKYNMSITGNNILISKKIPTKLIKYEIDTFHMLNILLKKSKLPFTFTFVRNPYERSLSLYNHAIKEDWFTGSFEAYLEFVEGYYYNLENLDHKGNINNFKNKFGNSITNIIQEAIPQHYYLFNEDSSTNVNFIGKYENLDEDWEKISLIFKNKLHLDLDNKLPVLNERGTCSYEVDFNNKCFHLNYDLENFNEKIKNLIYKIYEKDFTLLNYSTDLPNFKEKIVFRLEKNLNDDYFNLTFLLNEKDSNEKDSNEKDSKELSLKFYNNFIKSLPSNTQNDIHNYHSKIMKNLSNVNKIQYLLKKVMFFSLHLLPKFKILIND